MLCAVLACMYGKGTNKAGLSLLQQQQLARQVFQASPWKRWELGSNEINSYKTKNKSAKVPEMVYAVVVSALIQGEKFSILG